LHQREFETWRNVRVEKGLRADNRHLSRAPEDLPFTPHDDLPAFATRVFDFAMAYPDLMRLMA
jgi:hypothetical protein